MMSSAQYVCPQCRGLFDWVDGLDDPLWNDYRVCSFSCFEVRYQWSPRVFISTEQFQQLVEVLDGTQLGDVAPQDRANQQMT